MFFSMVNNGLVEFETSPPGLKTCTVNQIKPARSVLSLQGFKIILEGQPVSCHFCSDKNDVTHRIIGLEEVF